MTTDECQPLQSSDSRATQFILNFRQFFLPGVSFVNSLAKRTSNSDPTILVESVWKKSETSISLETANLPVLTVPEYGRYEPSDKGNLALVAVEGRDRRISASVAQLVSPASIGLALVHVTWLSGIVSSPIDAEGIDNPDPYDLLLYQGAREALVGTAASFHDCGFTVSTHLREHRDPAIALHRVVDQSQPILVIMGLGRHGAGIGHRLQQLNPVPVLYVKSR